MKRARIIPHNRGAEAWKTAQQVRKQLERFKRYISKNNMQCPNGRNKIAPIFCRGDFFVSGRIK